MWWENGIEKEVSISDFKPGISKTALFCDQKDPTHFANRVSKDEEKDNAHVLQKQKMSL